MPAPSSQESLLALDRRIVACERCPRLRRYCQRVAQEKRASFADWDYWGRPVPNLYDEQASRIWLLIVGLAPAAHGANRTGRMFTGDRSGDFLFRAMYETGFCNQPDARRRDDGLKLHGALITAAAHCAPPGNKPTPRELVNCSVHLRDTFDALPHLRVVLALGQLGHRAVLNLYKERGLVRAFADHPFAHGAVHRFADERAPTLLDTYHPSQQNTFTGRLTPMMLRKVFERAKEGLGSRVWGIRPHS